MKKTMVHWSIEEIELMLPFVLRSLEEGVGIVKAVNIAQERLPEDRRRKFIQSQQLPPAMALALKLIESGKVQVEKIEAKQAEEPPRVCMQTGGECPVHREPDRSSVLSSWLVGIMTDAAASIARDPRVMEMVAQGMTSALSRVYVPKDAIAQANSKAVIPLKPQPVVLIIGIPTSARPALESRFNGVYNFRFWHSTTPQDLLEKCKGVNFAIGCVNMTNPRNFDIARSAGLKVTEVQGHVDELITWIERNSPLVREKAA